MQPKVKKPQLKTGQKVKKDFSFPLEKENFVIIGAGIVLIILGYLLMNQNSVDGFVPTVISPIMLFLGYCVIIPYGILKGHRANKTETAAAGTGLADNPNVVPDTSKPNIKTS
jgi:hypothetical protein